MSVAGCSHNVLYLVPTMSVRNVDLYNSIFLIDVTYFDIRGSIVTIICLAIALATGGVSEECPVCGLAILVGFAGGWGMGAAIDAIHQRPEVLYEAPKRKRESPGHQQLCRGVSMMLAGLRSR